MDDILKSSVFLENLLKGVP